MKTRFPNYNQWLTASWLTPKGWLLIQLDVRQQQMNVNHRGMPNLA